MNDNLDKTLEAWKEQRSPKNAQFASEEKFAADFLEKAAQLPSEKIAKKTFWPIVCKLAACLVVVICLAVILLKLNGMKRTESRHDVSIAKVPQNELVKEMKQQVEEAEEVVAETVASKPVMAKATSKTRLADSDGGLALKPSQPVSLPVTVPMANTPIVVNDDAIALDGNGELVMLKAKQKGNMTISRDDGKEVNILGYYETNCELADIVLENQTVDYSKLQFDKMSISSSDAGDLDTSLIVDGDTIVGNAYVMTDILKSADLTIDRGDVKNNVENLNIEANTIANADVAANRVRNISNHITYDTLIDGNIADTANILSGVRADDAGVVALNISRSTNIVAPPIMNNDMNDGWMANPISQNTEEYKDVSEKPFLAVITNPLSTFGADVDTAGYGMMRRMILQDKRLPLPNTVRIEELLNYFHYDYPMPEKDEMMRPYFEIQAAPWNPSHQLLLVGVQAKKIPVEELPHEAQRIFVKGMTRSMVTICRDVKFQLEFNPSKVFAYRQLGYELREMASSDFRNGAKDSGDVGMGQQVTMLYELVPAKASEDIKKQAVPGWQPLKYAKTEAIANYELLTFRMRYKLPQGDAPAVEKTMALTTVHAPTSNWNWASSVAETVLRLRRSPYAVDANYGRALKRAQTALGDDADGQRAEFLLLIHRIQELDAK